MKEGSAAAKAAADGTREGDRLRLSKRFSGSFYICGQGALSGKTDKNIPFAQGERGIFFLESGKNSQQKSRIFDLFAKLYIDSLKEERIMYYTYHKSTRYL